MVKKNLDFIVIGAAKAGTTTLFEILRSHPEIFIPSGKELPFFSDTEAYKEGVDKYMNENFSKANTGDKIGTVTPQYLTGNGTVKSISETAERIKKNFPKVKLVAILRDPIERAFSHYQMHKREEIVEESFSEIVSKLTSKSPATRDRGYLFIEASKYGERLKEYYSRFNRKQILILFTKDLRENPEFVIREVFKFIGVDDGYVPTKLGHEYHVGGAQLKIPLLSRSRLHRRRILRKIWITLLPLNLRAIINRKISHWNAAKIKINIDEEDRHKLVGYYRADVTRLKDLIRNSVPWDDF